MGTTILKEIITDAVPRFTMQQDAAHYEHQSPKHEEDVPCEIRDYKTVPSFLQLINIHLSAILLYLQKEEVS